MKMQKRKEKSFNSIFSMNWILWQIWMKEKEGINQTVLCLWYCSSSFQMHGLVQHRHRHVKQRMKDRISCSDLVKWLEVTSLVSIIFPHWPLALSLVFPGPVGLLTVLAAVGRVPAAPVYRLWFTLVTLKTENKVRVRYQAKRGQDDHQAQEFKHFYGPNLLEQQIERLSVIWISNKHDESLRFVVQQNVWCPSQAKSATHPLLLLVLWDALPMFLREIFHLWDVVRPTSLQISLETPIRKHVSSVNQFYCQSIYLQQFINFGYYVNYTLRCTSRNIKTVFFYLSIPMS